LCIESSPRFLDGGLIAKSKPEHHKPGISMSES
jgi:hypothetical protein